MINYIYICKFSDSSYIENKEKYCHIFIDKNAENIIECNDFKNDILNINEQNYYIIAYEEDIAYTEMGLEKMLAIYAILYNIYIQNNYSLDNIKIINGEEMNEDFTSEIDFEYFFGFDLIELMKMNTNSINKFKSIKEKIEELSKQASDIIENSSKLTRHDIEQTKYAKLYRLGIQRFNQILKSHMFNENEVCEYFGDFINYATSDDLYNFIDNSYIQKKFFDELENKFSKYPNLNKNYLYQTIKEETAFCMFDGIFYKDLKEYVHLINVFKCWSIIKETFPSSLTINVLKKYENRHLLLNKDEAKELLLAYMLLAEEAKTIKNYKSEDLIPLIYNKITSGTYISGQNFVRGKYQINLRNVKLFLFRSFL